MEEFKNIPVDILVAGPLVAVAEAQKHLSASMYSFIKEVALDEKGEVKNVHFNYRVDEGGKSVKKNISAPFLAMTSIPNLAMEHVTIDFEMEVNATKTNKEETESGATAGYKGFWGANFSGSLSHKSEQTRKSDTRAKYTFHVEAKKQETPEALMRIIESITSDTTKSTQIEEGDKKYENVKEIINNSEEINKAA